MQVAWCLRLAGARPFLEKSGAHQVLDDPEEAFTSEVLELWAGDVSLGPTEPDESYCWIMLVSWAVK